jgi:hypothetical protein
VSLRPLVYVVGIPLLLGLAVLVQVVRDRGWQPYEPRTPVLWLQNAPLMQRAALGFDSLVADVYWMRAVVYFGRQRLSHDTAKNYDLLYPFLQFVTTLDARFTTAYRFGAVFLSERPPGGPHRPDLAIQLLKRGAERTPERWEYLHDIGFVYFWTLQDHLQAAEWYERASHIEGAPLWLKSTAAAMLLEGGDRHSARVIWQHMHDSTSDEWLKQESRTRLAQFDALDVIDQLNQRIWAYKLRTGAAPTDWDNLIAAGMLRGVPRDPAGVPFEIDRDKEMARVSEKSPLWPMPQNIQPRARE